MKKKFKDLMIGQVFNYELFFEGQFIRGIKKSSKTALMCLDKNEKNDFIMNFNMNEIVNEANITYIPFIK